jgi:hypothetical protein
MIEAEELGITSQNVDEMLKSTSTPTSSEFWGLPAWARPWIDEKWAYNIVKQVGTTVKFSSGTWARALLLNSIVAEQPLDKGRADVCLTPPLGCILKAPSRVATFIEEEPVPRR